MVNCEYDVAFSLLSEDERFAVQLSDILSRKFRVFLYADRQKELVGRDGLEEFSAVFRVRSRVCVVLHRRKWGTTKWTRIEETAIKERALEEGWEFLLVISLDGSSPPVWLPKTKLWLGLKQYGLDAAAAVIDARIQEAGASGMVETPRELAGRLRNESQRKAQKDRLLNSEQGVKLAEAERGALAQLLQKEVQELEAAGTPIQFISPRWELFYVRSPQISVTFGWYQQFSNSLQDAGLAIRVLKGSYHHDGWGEGPREDKKLILHLDLDLGGNPVWSTRDGQLFTSIELAEKFLKAIVEGTYGNASRRYLKT